MKRGTYKIGSVTTLIWTPSKTVGRSPIGKLQTLNSLHIWAPYFMSPWFNLCYLWSILQRRLRSKPKRNLKSKLEAEKGRWLCRRIDEGSEKWVWDGAVCGGDGSEEMRLWRSTESLKLRRKVDRRWRKKKVVWRSLCAPRERRGNKELMRCNP